MRLLLICFLFPIFLVAVEGFLQEEILFLEENRKRAPIYLLEKGEIQYEILQKGGKSSLQEYHSPVLKLQKRSLSGSFTEELPQKIIIEELPEGIKKGILGMQEGEKRILYIHPKWTEENALLIVEVELLQIENPYQEVDSIHTFFAKEGTLR